MMNAFKLVYKNRKDDKTKILIYQYEKMIYIINNKILHLYEFVQ